MVSVGINLLGQVAKTAAFGAITGKVIDTVLSSKINKKNDQLKWIRETKLEFFTKLSQEIMSYDLVNSEAQIERNIKEHVAKVILLIDDKRLILKLEDYINELNKAKRSLIYKENYSEELIEKFNEKGMNLVIALNNNLKRS